MVLINADFSQRVAVHAARAAWIESPMPGVARKMLDRIGAEVARATSIVRYAPGSHFSAHSHDGGEEFLVLEGVFQDENGDYPAGYYVRNPPSSRHRPASESGCVIFVKLHQFDPADRAQIRIDSNLTTTLTGHREKSVAVVQLYLGEHEDVRLEHWAAGASINYEVTDGLEAFVVLGEFEENGEAFTYCSWLRLPAGVTFHARAGSAGASVWIKTSPFRNVVR